MLRRVFGAWGVPAWDAGALGALEVGAWAHEPLLALAPEVSLAIAEQAP